MTGVSLLSPCRIPQHGGVFCIKSEQRRKRNTSQPLPLCSCKEYRGSARRARGLEYKQKHKPRSFQPLSVTNIQVYLMNFLLNHNTNKNTILSPSHRTPITIIPRYDRRLPFKKNNLQTTLFHYIFVLYINSRKIFDNTSAFKTKTFIMKKITLLLAFFICLNISLNAQTYPKKENVIRLLTYNTHYCKGGSDPGSIDDYNTRRLASVIEALDPDVVALQELDSAMSVRRRRDL